MESLEDRIACNILHDPGYRHADPELPFLDRFTLTSTGVLADDHISAFVRAGLHRSFTARKVPLPPGSPLWRTLCGQLIWAGPCCCLCSATCGGARIGCTWHRCKHR